MPREDRRVIFDFSEAYQAIYKLALKSDDAPRLPPGVIRKAEEDGLDANKINIYLENPQTGEKEMMTYSRDFIAAALMMFCRGSGIPLPRKANKTVMLDIDRITLRVLV
jgi:hypothetical protein